MDIKEKLEKIIDIISELHLEDDNTRDKCWKEEIELLTKDINATIKCLDVLDSKYFDLVAEVFDDISRHFQSKELIECMKRNAKRTGVDCNVEIQYAIEALNK